MLVVGSLIRQLLTPRISNKKTDIVDSIHLPTTLLHICCCVLSGDYLKHHLSLFHCTTYVLRDYALFAVSSKKGGFNGCYLMQIKCTEI